MPKTVISIALFFSAAVAVAAPQHFILQPDHVLSQTEIAELAAQGIDVQRVLPGARYLVRADNADAIANEGRVEYFGAAHKIAPSAAHFAARGLAFTTVRLVFH